MTLIDELEALRVLAILRRADIDRVVEPLCDKLVSAGVRAIEVTLDQESSLPALRRLVAHAPPETWIGAGTVMSVEQVELAADAGASFLVCPHVDVSLIAAAHRRGLEILPGVTSGTEVATALAAGAKALKLFPAGPLTPSYLQALRGPFPQTAFVPTGGIGVEQVQTWLDAGAAAVGLGGALFDGDDVHSGLASLLRGPR